MKDKLRREPRPFVQVMCGLLLAAVVFAITAHAQTAAAPAAEVQNLYAIGGSYNTGQTGAQAVAGTALYAHAISPDTTSGMYAFTAMDAVPSTLKPFTVSTNVSVGIAEKVATINGVEIFAPTAAGVTFNGVNTGWNWNVGGMAAFRIKSSDYYIMPTVRMLKSSIGGSGYQPILGVLFGWGK